MRTERRVALLSAVTGAVVLVVLAAWLVPWHPVPGGVPAPASPGSVFTATQVRRGEEYSSGARLLGWLALATSLLVLGALGLTGAGRRLVGRLPGPWWCRVALAVVAVRLLVRVATLVFAILSHRRAVAHGLSDQSWAGFASDVVRNEAVGAVAMVLGLLVVIACARRWPRAWPAVAGGLLAALVFVGSFAYPVVVEPLFNHFTPLPDGALRTAILALAADEGVHVDDVLVADASRRTTTLNAYVSGFGSTRRVVVYDTLVDGLPRDQALSVVAHELGHARHDDVLVGSSLGAAGALLGVGLLGLLLGGGDPRRRSRVADPAAVPLLLVLVAVGSLLASPAENAVSRQIETRADVDALRATHDPEAFVAMQRQLALRSLADPTPPAWSQLWFGSHPTTLTRVAIARDPRTSQER
jgi:Zn-dependent protease with chaperone function